MTRPAALGVVGSALAVVVACGGAPDVRTTETARARARAEAQAFDEAVAAEPAEPRLDVQRVERGVLYDRERASVYVLDPALVALAAEDGAERWRTTVRGDVIERVGMSLAVTTFASDPAPFTLVAPDGATVIACDVRPVDAPGAADRFTLTPFSRDGALYAVWQSSTFVPPVGDPGSALQAQERARAGAGCGLVAIDRTAPTGCVARAASLPFVTLDARCLLPTRGTAAVTASMAPAMGPGEITITIDREALPGPSGCAPPTRELVHVVGPRGEWRHPLRESPPFCPVP